MALDGVRALQQLSSLSDMQSFFEAAGRLNDTELAVAIQGLLGRRRGAKEALLSAWLAEAVCENGAGARGSIAAVPASLPVTSSALSSAMAASPETQPAPSFMPPQRAPPRQRVRPAERIQLGARRIAAARSAKDVGTEHFLAAAVAIAPEVSKAANGPLLHRNLVELLDKSNLSPPGRGGPPGDSLNLQPAAQPLVQAMEASVSEGSCYTDLFKALNSLPDGAAASQLIEMAKVFARNEDPEAFEAEAQSTTLGADSEDASAASAAVGTPEPVSTGSLLQTARCIAAFNQAKAVDTEHVLAALVYSCQSSMKVAVGDAIYQQLVLLLEKSSLEPPSQDSPAGEDLRLEPQTLEFCEKCEGARDGQALGQFLEELPDDTSVTQLIEMAKVFAERAAYAD